MDLNLAQTPPDVVKDGSEATFMADVIEASRQTPVIVDFWATWCGPCKTLGPQLEEAVKAQRGKVRMVKIDVDKNQMLAGQLRIQSIPTVYAFVNGQPVDGFQGAIGPGQVRQFVEKLAGMAGADGLDEALDAAEDMLKQGAISDAAQTFAAILQEDEGNIRAIAGLARAHLALGERDRARAILELAPAAKAADPALAAIRAQIELAEQAAQAKTETAALEARLAADPNDHQARFDLAVALTGAGQTERAMDELLELFRRDRDWNDGAAKAQLIKLFDSLGPKDPVGQRGRRRLSSMIFA